MQNRAVMPSATTNSGIRDNHRRGLVADFLRAKIKSGSVARTFQKRVAIRLQSDRGFKIPNVEQQARETADFELVTWLVIKSSS